MCTCETFVYPSAGSARSTVAPAGSAIPGRCVTSTRASNIVIRVPLFIRPEPIVEARAR